MTLKPLQLAKINWTDEGYPINTEADDKYFSGNGIGESNTVFLQGNKLLQRWQNWQEKTFSILETGFGSGLNFLLTLQLWKEAINNKQLQSKQLRYFSIERSPVLFQDLQKIHQLWPELHQLSKEVLRKIPQPVPGRHLIKFHHQGYCCELFLLYADIADALPELIEEQLTAIDAFFLDGFSPNKNPDMWQSSVFNHLSKLANDDATLATYTAASSVTKQLDFAGFLVTKRKGYGAKREMLTATFKSAQLLATKKQQNFHSNNNKEKILVIGAGLAGSITAAKLAARGFLVDLVEAGSQLCFGASGNAAGIAYPRLGNSYAEACQLQLCGDSFLHAELVDLESISGNFNGMDFLYGRQYPNSRVNNKTIERLNLQSNYIKNTRDCGDEKIEFLKAGWVEPASIAKAYLKPFLENGQVSLLYNAKITKLIPNYNLQNNSWSTTGVKSIANTKYRSVYICNGSDVADLLPQYQPFTIPIRGQIDCFKVTDKHNVIERPICAKGYIIPYKKNDCSESIYWVGASYQRKNASQSLCFQETENHRQKLSQFIQLSSERIHHQQSRVATRLSTVDRLPLVGQVALEKKYSDWYMSELKRPQKLSRQPLLPGLFVNVGHGSHGLITIPIMSEFLVRKSLQEPSLISKQIKNAVDPQRYFKRIARKHNSPNKQAI